MKNPDYNRLAFATGHFPLTTQACIRCFSPFSSPLYMTCDNCRDADLLMPAVQAIRQEWEASGILKDLWPDRAFEEMILAEDERLTREINYPM